VRLLAGQDGHALAHIGEAEIDGHPEAIGYRLEPDPDVVSVQTEAVEFELDTLEEHALDSIDVLFGVHDVAIVVGEELRHGGDDAALVRAAEQ
jgi:hypothetical protein